MTVDGEAAGIRWKCSWQILNGLITKNIGEKILVKVQATQNA